MRRFTRLLLSASFMLALLSFGLTKALACEMHYPGGTIGNCPDQTCADFIDPGDGTYCVECLSNFYNPNTTYISYNKKLSEAWIITGSGKPIRVMSDKYKGFTKMLSEKYSKLKKDKAVTEKIKNEYADFFKTDDNKVSAKRLETCSKLLNLKVRNV
jgi:hypothetical protein